MDKIDILQVEPNSHSYDSFCQMYSTNLIILLVSHRFSGCEYEMQPK